MDTSKEYIKMCEKAKEIQKHKEENYDYYFWQERVCVVREYDEIAGWSTSFCQDEVIWLPRQDQLQEMVRQDTTIGTDTIRLEDIATLFDRFENWRFYTALKASWSGEQLWLAFVMKDKYNKVWNGKEWKQM